ncbi:MAG TPA: CARDB domain-containing protein, partial [Anaerolineales bacterium]|nr:CARDB domain-containing protein [Anaerolineales bacterium]
AGNPDLEVTIEVYPPDEDLDPNIYLNDDVHVFIEVKNITGVDAGPFTVNIYVDDVYVECEDTNRSYYKDLTGLEGGKTELLKLTLPAGLLPEGAHTIRVYADSGCAVAEDNEANNFGVVEFAVNPVLVAPPSHDEISSPIVIASLPYTHSVDVRGATRDDVNDPTDVGCPAPDHILDAGLASVWYEYTPTETAVVTLDTLGSNYDTYIAVWQGTPGTTLVGCNDDYGG